MAESRVIRFNDLDGNLVEEEWWFEFHESDAIDLPIFELDDPIAYLTSIFQEQNAAKLLRVMREMLFAAVGKRAGSRLAKGPEITAEFRDKGAYRQLFSDLIESEDGGLGFIISLLPKHVQEKARAEAAAQVKTYTKEEKLAMTDEEFASVAGKDIQSMELEDMQIAMQRKTDRRKIA